MPTELIKETEVVFEAVASTEIQDQVEAWEEAKVGHVLVTVDFEDLLSTKPLLLGLRASNISVLLRLKPLKEPAAENLISTSLTYLRDWDQLLLDNLLQLLKHKLPENYERRLADEGRIEWKWFKEWITASQDQNLTKYPGLPWRSFMRKTVGENYDFAQYLLEDGKNLETSLEAFLKLKKQAVCIFPKRWRRASDTTH